MEIAPGMQEAKNPETRNPKAGRQRKGNRALHEGPSRGKVVPPVQPESCRVLPQAVPWGIMECQNGVWRSENAHTPRRESCSLLVTRSGFGGFDDLNCFSSCDCLRLGQTVNPTTQTQNPRLNFGCEVSKAGSVNPRPFTLNPQPASLNPEPSSRRRLPSSSRRSSRSERESGRERSQRER